MKLIFQIFSTLLTRWTGIFVISRIVQVCERALDCSVNMFTVEHKKVRIKYNSLCINI